MVGNMCFLGYPLGLLTLALTLCVFTPGTCQLECHPKFADLGQPLQLQCSAAIACSSFTWLKGDEALIRDSSFSYTVTDSVTVNDGGTYSCQCEINNNTQCFTVCVRPTISLFFTSNPVTFGSSVNVTCTAVSYPEANPDTDYIIQHPIGETLIHEHITDEMDGVIYEIDSAVDSDNGTFKCHLTVNCMDQPMMNEIVKILTVTNETTFSHKLTIHLPSSSSHLVSGSDSTTLPTATINEGDSTTVTMPTNTPTKKDNGSVLSSSSKHMIVIIITLYVLTFVML